VLAIVREHFKPEFLNRLDDIVVFDSLTTEELTKIVDIQIAGLARRLESRRLTLDVTDGAREWLAINGFDPVYGARPLRRVVQTAIGDALARELLAGEIRDGQTVHVDVLDDRTAAAVRCRMRGAGLGADSRRATMPSTARSSTAPTR